MYACVAPMASVVSGGTTSSTVTALGSTVRSQPADDTPSTVATSCVVPAARAWTRPATTVATVVSLLDHTACAVTSPLVASLKYAVAAKRRSTPGGIWMPHGDTTTLSSAAVVTVKRSVSPCTPANACTSRASPGDNVCTWPGDMKSATAGSRL